MPPGAVSALFVLPMAWIPLYFKCHLGFWLIFYSLLLTITINLGIYCPPTDFPIGTHDSSLKIQNKWFPAKMFINFLSSVHPFYFKYITIIDKMGNRKPNSYSDAQNKDRCICEVKMEKHCETRSGLKCGTAKFSQGIGTWYLKNLAFARSKN